jgi:hypothetical protein
MRRRELLGDGRGPDLRSVHGRRVASCGADDGWRRGRYYAAEERAAQFADFQPGVLSGDLRAALDIRPAPSVNSLCFMFLFMLP